MIGPRIAARKTRRRPIRYLLAVPLPSLFGFQTFSLFRKTARTPLEPNCRLDIARIIYLTRVRFTVSPVDGLHTAPRVCFTVRPTPISVRQKFAGSGKTGAVSFYGLNSPGRRQTLETWASFTWRKFAFVYHSPWTQRVKSPVHFRNVMSLSSKRKCFSSYAEWKLLETSERKMTKINELNGRKIVILHKRKKVKYNF